MEPFEHAQETDFQQRIAEHYASLSDIGQKIADVIIQNPQKVIHLTITQMAEIAEVSEASIVRFCRTLGYEGFHSMKIYIAGDLQQAPQIHEDISPEDDDATLVKKVFSSELRGIQDTLKTLDMNAFSQAVDAMARCNRIEFYAFGNARPIAMDAHYRLLRIGLRSQVGVDVVNDLMSASMLGYRDVAFAISHSGSTKPTIQGLKNAREAGAFTICLTGFSKAPITKFADVTLCSRSTETEFRDEAMASRIAQLCIMDALYVAVAFRQRELSQRALERTGRLLSEEKV